MPSSFPSPHAAGQHLLMPPSPLAFSERTLRRMIAAGRVTGYRAGPRLIRVDLNELDAVLRSIPTAGGAA